VRALKDRNRPFLGRQAVLDQNWGAARLWAAWRVLTGLPGVAVVIPHRAALRGRHAYMHTGHRVGVFVYWGT
jgi:hypothetical protein